MTPETTWRKSRYSVNGHDCIELRNTLDQLRDSKNTPGPTLHANVPALVRAIQTNQLDH